MAWGSALGPPLRVTLPLSWRIAHVYNWVVLSAYFLRVEFWEPDCLLSFHPFSVHFVRAGRVSTDRTFWKNVVGLTYVSWGFTPLDQRVSHRAFLDNFISTSGFYWDDWGHPWATVSSKSPCVKEHSDLLIDRSQNGFQLVEHFAMVFILGLVTQACIFVYFSRWKWEWTVPAILVKELRACGVGLYRSTSVFNGQRRKDKLLLFQNCINRWEQ